MNKGKGIGIAVAVIALAVVFGIASLPDEVLLESPQLDASENLPSKMIPMDIAIEKVPIVEPIQEVVEEPIVVAQEEPIEEVVDEPENPDESEGKLITVTINDGVGTKMK